MKVPWDRPRGAIHSLARLEELSNARCHILCVSERTLYLLHNFASQDVRFRTRYSVEETDFGYEPLSRDSIGLWSLFLDVVNGFQLEVIEMTCDIQSGLESIADALADLSINVNCGGGYGPADGGAISLPCIGDLSNENLLGPGESEQGNPAVDPPPDGFATWEEYFDYKCKAAEFIWDLERKHMVMLRNFELIALTASIVGPIAAGLLGVLPAAMTPAGFVVFVSSIVAIGIVAGASWFYMDEMIDYWDTNHQAIVCSLYSSGTSVEAVSSLANALEDAIQAIVSWGALEPIAGTIAGLLSEAFAQLAGNGIVEPLFKAVVAATQYTANCDDCGGGSCCGTRTFTTAEDPGPGIPLAGSLNWGEGFGRLTTPGWNWQITNTGLIRDTACRGVVISVGFSINYWVKMQNGSPTATFKLRIHFTDETFVDGTAHVQQTPPAWQNPGLGNLSPHWGKTVDRLELIFTQGSPPQQSDVYLDDYECICP